MGQGKLITYTLQRLSNLLTAIGSQDIHAFNSAGTFLGGMGAVSTVVCA